MSEPGAPPDPALRQPPTFALAAASDAEFTTRLPAIEAYLVANFPGLRGLRQHRPHFDPERERTTDPIEHTLEVIAALDTHDLPSRDVLILRAATVFHDVGKLLDPLNVRHALESAVICPPYLADFPLTPAECRDAVAIVRNHDVLGRIAQGRLTAGEGADLFGTRRLAVLTERLTVTDISSIRGLGHVLPNIAAAYEAILAEFDARERREAERGGQ
ncbi:MAG: hypothetical protein ACTHMU_17120 [Thermomicrobiales bacterium]